MAGVALLFALSSRAADTRWFVVLDGKPLAATATPGRSAAPAAAPADRRAQLRWEQDVMAAVVESLGGRVLERYEVLNHALFVEVPEDQVAALRSAPGVKGVHRERHYQRRLATSVPFIGANTAWAGQNGLSGVTGKGVRIGIVDSGIDYTHAMFGGKGTTAAYAANNPSVIESGSFPTAKVAGGTDFVGDNYDSAGVFGSSTPVPDRDPLDPSDNGHGTHVAGIAAGYGVLTGGATYRGPYTTGLDPAQFRVGPGVAPEAALYALKVFGTAGSTSSSIVVKALNWAADPNGDGNTADHLDVVNISLGSSFADDNPGDPEREAIDNLVQVGCAVAASAGNGGDTAFKVDSPSTATRAVSVASSIDGGYGTGAIQVNSPSSVAGKYAAVEAEFSMPLDSVPPIRAKVVMAIPALACDPLSNASGVAGKIVMVDRGTCNFDEKVQNAEDAGAVAAIVVNNVDGPPFVMGSGSGIFPNIPAVMISKADGTRLRAQISQGLDVTLSASTLILHPEYADTVETYSSRGPVYSHAMLKPDISAPGAGITSSKAGSGADGVAYSGTSMSSPHVAGALALVKQAHPDWPAEDLKAVVMNTAVTPMRDLKGKPYAESRVGAGRVAVDRAVLSPLSVRAQDDGGAVSLSFGMVVATGPTNLAGAYVVSNHGAVPLTLQVVSSNTLVNPGVALVPSVTSVTVAPHASATVDVRLSVDPKLLKADPDDTSDPSLGGYPRFAVPEGSGELWFLGGPVDVHVPWYALVRAGSQQVSPTRTAGTPAGDKVTVPVPLRGANGHARPLVGVFQFGSSSPIRHFGDDRDVTDLVAVGAASDYSKSGSVTSARVYFALVTADGWASPQRVFHDFEIEVDRTGDGVADLVLANNNQGSTAGNNLEDSDSANDAFVTAVDRLDGSALQFGGTLNGLAPTVADTAPFNSGVMVHSATGAQLGLTAAKPSFQYRATTTGTFSDTAPGTGWVKFDPTRPVVDGTPFGVQNTPWQDEGPAVKASISRPNATAAGIQPNGQVTVLLVHAHALPGSQSETVRFNLSTDDFDGDGLPDVWELSNFGDLSATAGGDPDGDGFTNAQELALGSNPVDAKSGLALVPPARPGDALTWASVAGRRYSVLRAEAPQGPYAPVQSGIVAGGAVTGFTDPALADAGQAYFYRVQLDP